MPGVRRGHHRIRTHHQQRPHLGAQRVQQLVRTAPRTRERVGIDPPHLRDMAARRRVGELAVAGQLVGLLAVFTASLAVALPRQTAVAGQRPARAPGGQGEVDPGADGVRALRLLLGAARGQHHAALRVAEHLDGRPQLRNRNAGQPLHQLRPVGHHPGPRLVPAAGALPYEVLVHPPLRHHQVQHAERERQVGAGPGGQMEVGLLGGPGAARIDDDEPAAVLPQLGQIAQRGRHRLREIRPHEDHAPGTRDVLQRERQPAVQAEGPLVRGGRRRHAEPPVVVDLRGAEHHPGELPERVRLLVGQPAATEHPHRVGPVLRARPPQSVGDPGQRLVPAGRLQLPARRIADQRTGQPHRGGEHGGRGTALAAQGAPVHREGGALLHLDDRVTGDRAQVHAALQRAVRAVGRGRGRRDAGHAPSLRAGCYTGARSRLHRRYAHLSPPGTRR